ncbi:MAG TPA: EF-hand domain-containing protein [Rhizomicrobium sp.]|nr:EF-hand domain-containing protein [Rhizomicrobium sp.]
MGGLAMAMSAMVVAAGAASAQSDDPAFLQSRDRAADRLFARFDLNHDGRVSKDELNKAETARFAAATHGPSMSADQYAASDMAEFQQHAAQAFRRLDWNGDGRLSLEEYAEPQRVRFAMFDSDGKGRESCAPVQTASFKPGRGGFGHARFCADNDLDRDGNVTHAEFDSVTAKHFAALAGNGKTMSAAQFSADALVRWRAIGARFFKRLDANHDGKLSLAEFAAPDVKLFDRLDRNRDGWVTRDETRRVVPQKRG